MGQAGRPRRAGRSGTARSCALRALRPFVPSRVGRTELCDARLKRLEVGGEDPIVSRDGGHNERLILEGSEQGRGKLREPGGSGQEGFRGEPR